MRRRPVVGLLALALYLGLMAASAICPGDHVGSHAGHQHHPATALQSSLCAWACQASSADALIAGTLPLPVVLVHLLFAVLAATAPAVRHLGTALTRGPPLRPAV